MFFSTLKVIIIDSGLGPGGYYFAVLLQILVIYPFLYVSIKKKPILSSVVVFFVCTFYEIIVMYSNMPAWLYRLISIRYFPFIVAGIILGMYIRKMNFSQMIVSFIIGIIFIGVMNYTPCNPILFSQWVTTAFPTVFYAVFFVFIAVKYINIKNIILQFIVFLIGQASYHVFLFQMLYYHCCGWLIYKIIGVNALSLFVNVVICITSGIIFFALEEAILHKKNIFINTSEILKKT